MTSEDRVIELMDRANPVPDPNDLTLPSEGGAYLRRLEERSHAMTLTPVDPSTTDPDSTELDDRAQRRPWLLVVAVAAAITAVVAGLVAIGTRSDDDPVPADRPTQTTEPEGDDEAAPTSSAPEPTLPAPTTTVAAPERLVTGKVLDGGRTYRTSNAPDRGMTPEMALTIPVGQGEAAWSVLNAFPLEVTFIPHGDWVTPGVREPTFGLAPVTEGVSVDEAVASVQAYAANDADFEVSVDRGRIDGEDVTVLRGSDTRRSGDDLRVPTSSNSGFMVPPGRAFVVYLIDGPTHVVAAKIESRQTDLDAVIERVVPILDTIEFP